MQGVVQFHLVYTGRPGRKGRHNDLVLRRYGQGLRQDIGRMLLHDPGQSGVTNIKNMQVYPIGDLESALFAKGLDPADQLPRKSFLTKFIR